MLLTLVNGYKMSQEICIKKEKKLRFRIIVKKHYHHQACCNDNIETTYTLQKMDTKHDLYSRYNETQPKHFE